MDLPILKLILLSESTLHVLVAFAADWVHHARPKFDDKHEYGCWLKLDLTGDKNFRSFGYGENCKICFGM